MLNTSMLMLQSLEVHVLEGPQAQVRTVKVHIDVSQKQGKAYKGGYRDKRNGTLYHHADCQTDKQVRACLSRLLKLLPLSEAAEAGASVGCMQYALHSSAQMPTTQRKDLSALHVQYKWFRFPHD